jgi:hypothetical protein
MSAHGVPSEHGDTLDAWVAVMPPSEDLARLLGDLRPAELALRDWVRTQLNASIVREMAGLDHGMQVEEHRRGIEALLEADRLPEELPWAPREVLELSSHSAPNDPQRRPGSAGWRGHVARLFSCLVLVRADDALNPAGTLAGLVESALELSPEAMEQALRYLAWCRLHEPGTWRDDGARPFLTLGLLLSYIMTPGHGDPVLTAALHQAFVDEVQLVLPPEHWWPDQTPSALLKKTAGAKGWRTWQMLVDRCLIAATAGGGGPGDRRAVPGLADHGQTAMSIGTLRTRFRVEHGSGPLPGDHVPGRGS